MLNSVMHGKEDIMSIRNVFEEMTSFERLLNAEKAVGSGKKGLRNEALAFREDLESNLFYLQECMIRLRPPDPKFHIFYVFEPKVRKVIDIDYKNKVIQRVAYDVINPRVCKGFIADTYSCIKGRGQLEAMKCVYGWERHVSYKPGKWYYLKLDVAKFFYRISHKKLCEIVDKKISDKRAATLIKFYICDNPIPMGLPLGTSPTEIATENMLWDIGIAIGGGLSHMLGNMYLDVLDQYCKRCLGIKYYARYMDDIIILSNDKAQLHAWKQDIENFLMRELFLNLNNKTMICPIDKGVEFVGYRIFPTHVTLRRSTSLRIKRSLRYLQGQYTTEKVSFEKVTATVNSYKALMKHCDSYHLKTKIFDNFILTHDKEALLQSR